MEDTQRRTAEKEPREEKSASQASSLFLQPSDGMVLVSAPLDGSNFLAWSRAMKMALMAKDKLGFVTGRCLMPDPDSDD